MNYEKEKKHDHLFTEWENKFTIKFNKDKEFNNIENPKKELLFIKVLFASCLCVSSFRRGHANLLCILSNFSCVVPGTTHEKLDIV